MQVLAWKNFFTEHNLDMEYSTGYPDPAGKIKTHFIRHGAFTDGLHVHHKVSKQLADEGASAPRLQNRRASRGLALATAPHIADLLAEMYAEVYDASSDEEEDPTSTLEDTAPPSSPTTHPLSGERAESTTPVQEGQVANFVTPQQASPTETGRYPLLKHLGFKNLDLSNEKTMDTMQNLVGEIVTLFSSSKDTPLNFKYRNGVPGQLITVPSTSPDNASFKRQAWKTKWIERVLEQAGTTRSCGAKRMCQYLASQY